MPPNEAEMIHFVVGTRAQLFKLAPVMLECEERDLDWRWVYTAQHRDTIERTAELFRLPPPDHVVVGWKTEAKSMGRMGLWFARMLTTKLQLAKLGLRGRLESNQRISLLPRLEYLPFLKAIRSAQFVVTDGGGNQEELSYLGKPTLILRDETERREGLGQNAVLAGLDHQRIESFVREYASYARPEALPQGSPSAVIVDSLEARGFG